MHEHQALHQNYSHAYGNVTQLQYTGTYLYRVCIGQATMASGRFVHHFMHMHYIYNMYIHVCNLCFQQLRRHTTH